MGRWEPDARGRLEKAAMELFQERGYARTTVQEIAELAGLTERTFFRHFTDKREVLFSGSKELQSAIVASIAGAPGDAAPLEVVVDAFAAGAQQLQGRRELAYVRARYALLLEHADLYERELIKLASLAAAVTEALRARGLREPAASMVAQTGMAAFKVGFERWVAGKKPADAAAQVRAAMRALRESMDEEAKGARAR